MNSRVPNDVEEFLFGDNDAVSRRNLALVGGEALIDHNESRKSSGFYSLIYSMLRFVELSSGQLTWRLSSSELGSHHILHTTGAFLR